MKTENATVVRSVFTIGHSNQPMDTFISLLKNANIDVLVDIRSHPSSAYASQFDGPQLKKEITTYGIKYLYMGHELGGKPQDQRFYDSDGRVLYSMMAETPSFLDGISRLERGIAKYRVAIMCSEESPVECHRRLLVSRVLISRGIDVYHIRSSGKVQTEEEVAQEEMARYSGAPQLGLFSFQEARPLRSTQSVSPRSQQSNSSVS